ncbi:magnesium and cobalt transport protein CorA [Nocardia sp. NEAU-G5]|uniref:Magnesium and cobalt transport protein CorA n=2 Tax=Nocardia albiluteola TaxID=2842303 RepID=A0ABS6AZI4_9NOCA|nr:magnesium and cobalt transport protein CorA [Nocardia albiluteola]MBU3063470.1 magnesium and cobalt transport protein CorA [Nocardia albiluteola]
MPQIPFRRRIADARPRIPVPTARAIVDCAVYRDGRRLPGRFAHAAALDEVRERGSGFVWVGLHEPDAEQMADVAHIFGLHELATEDAVHGHQRPKLERYDDILILVLRTVKYVEHERNAVSEIAIEATYQLKREVVELRRAVAPLSLPLQMLSHDTNLPLPKEIRRYFRDVADHHTATVDRVRDFDESLSALINAALARVSMQQNTDMRKISAWAAIAAVPTMIAGIYGMNFENMPELRWAWGYPVVLVIILTICTGLFITFRSNDWL